LYKRISKNNIRSGVIPFEYDGDDDKDSSYALFELNKRCFESTSFNDELKNFANVEIVDIYVEK
jgi:hypothetical protein